MPQHRRFRWNLIRDLLVFQVKLAADALRDLFLSPMALVAALIDLSRANQAKESLFYQLLRVGRRSDHWINLFGAAGAPQEDTTDSAKAESPQGQLQSLDHWVLQLEGLLKDQYERGGITASAKNLVDETLDRLRDKKAAAKQAPGQQDTESKVHSQPEDSKPFSDSHSDKLPEHKDQLD